MTQRHDTDGPRGQSRFDHMAYTIRPRSISGSAHLTVTDPARPPATSSVATFVFVDVASAPAKAADTISGGMAGSMAPPRMPGSAFKPLDDNRQAISIRGPVSMESLGLSLAEV